MYFDELWTPIFGFLLLVVFIISLSHWYFVVRPEKYIDILSDLNNYNKYDYDLLAEITKMYKSINHSELRINQETKLAIVSKPKVNSILRSSHLVLDMNLNMSMHPYLPQPFRILQESYEHSRRLVLPIYNNVHMLRSYYEKLLMYQPSLSAEIRKEFKANNSGVASNLNEILKKLMIHMTVAFDFGMTETENQQTPANIAETKASLLENVGRALHIGTDRLMDFITTLMTRSIYGNIKWNYDVGQGIAPLPEPLKQFKKLVIHKMDEIDEAASTMRQEFKLTKRNIQPTFLNTLMQVRNDRRHPKVTTENKSLCIKEVNSYMFMNISNHMELTTSTIIFCLIELTVNKRCQNLLQEEIDKYIEAPINSTAHEKLLKMDYLDYCVRETLRKYPVVPFILRKNIKNMLNNTHKMGINQFYVVPIMCYHRDSSLFDEPMSFVPERFKNSTLLNHSHYLPFGHNSRMCPGMEMVIMNIKIVLITILFEYSILNCNCYNKTAKDIYFDKNYVHLKPHGDVLFQLESRKNINFY